MALEIMLEIIQREFSFLEKEGFRVIHKSEGSYPNHIIRIGLESKARNMRLLFVQEAGTGLYIGSTRMSFLDESGWFYFERLVDYIQGRSLRWRTSRTDKPLLDGVLDDLAKMAKEFRQYNNKIYSMFRDQNTITEWDSDFESYVNKEIQDRLKRPS